MSNIQREGVIPVDIRTDQTKNIAYIKLSGSPDRDAILAAFDATVESPGYCAGMGRLWDFRDTDLSGLNAATIVALTKHSAGYPPGINDVKVAFVVSRELEYGLARMFEGYSQGAATPISVFYDLAEAEAWFQE